MANTTPFGSIMVGSGTRFKTTPGLSDDSGRANFDQAKARADEFAALRTGPDFTVEYEPATAVAADASDPLLRRLSPFMLQVEPPAVYADFGDQSDKKADPGQIVTVAQGVSNPFASARASLQSSALGMDRAGTQRNVENYISTNAAQHDAKGGTGKVGTDESGRASGRLGTPSIADLRAAVDIANQIKAAVNTPPLILLINPQSLSMSISKIQQFQDRTRHGYVFHAWGEEQPTLSIETRCGAFYSAGRGVQYASKRDSASWNNLMALFQLYKNNGYIYDTVGRSNAHHLVGTLSIHYDGWIYYGNLSSFSWTYEEGNQLGGLTVSMEFTISRMVDTSKATTAVLPMRGPNPGPNDPRFSRPRSLLLPPVYPVGADGSPNTVVGESPQEIYYQTETFPNEVPATRLSVTHGVTNFRSADESVPTVPQASSTPSDPFGFGG